MAKGPLTQLNALLHRSPLVSVKGGPKFFRNIFNCPAFFNACLNCYYEKLFSHFTMECI